MHIAFLTPEYPHGNVNKTGGIGTSIKNLAEGLIQQNHAVSVFVFGQQNDAVFKDQSINFHLLKTRKFKFFGWYLHRKYLQRYINKVIVSEQIQVLEAPDWTGITAFMRFKIPLIIRFHGTDAYFCKLEQRIQKKKNFILERKALLNADHIVSVSQFNADETKSIFKLKKQITVIHNGIDTNHFQPQNIFNKGTILYFGTLIRKKGVLELSHILNRVMSKFPEMTFRVAGNDTIDFQTQKSTKSLMLEQMSDALKEKTTWLGNLPYSDIKAEIANAHCIVLPSFAEAFPMTWLEAMAMEKAMVTSNIGWANEMMIDEKTGYTVGPKNHNLYAKRILELLKDDGLSARLGKEARKTVASNFSAEVITKKNIAYYKSIIT